MRSCLPLPYDLLERGTGFQSELFRSGRTLLRAGGGSAIVTRWAWRPAGEGRVACSVTVVSREGARVEVLLGVGFPPGRFTLAAAATPEDGLKHTAEAGLRKKLGSLPMTCFTGVLQPDCPAGLEVGLADWVAAKLGVGREALSLRIVPDPSALAAARRAALRDHVGRPPRRVLLVGWDGADWELLEPFGRRGVMPNLDRLMRAGSWGGRGIGGKLVSLMKESGKYLYAIDLVCDDNVKKFYEKYGFSSANGMFIRKYENQNGGK